jgi:hypothetical protein
MIIYVFKKHKNGENGRSWSRIQNFWQAGAGAAKKLTGSLTLMMKTSYKIDKIKLEEIKWI